MKWTPFAYFVGLATMAWSCFAQDQGSPPSTAPVPAAALAAEDAQEAHPSPPPDPPSSAEQATPAPALPTNTPDTFVLLKTGLASWYGPRFHGRRTASGERYDMHDLTAAHKYLPFGTKIQVRSVHTGESVMVTVNDRGPYKHQRILDLSRAAMDALGVLERGVTQVEVWVQAHQLNSFQAATERFRQRQAVSPKKQASGKLKNPAVHQRR